MFHCRSQQRSGRTSSESLALQDVYQDLVIATMYNTHSLAIALYTEGVISSSVRDEVFLQTLTPEMKANVLLRAVEAKVKVNPKQFMTFVSTLREHEELSFADRLMQAKGIPTVMLMYGYMFGGSIINAEILCLVDNGRMDGQ